MTNCDVSYILAANGFFVRLLGPLKRIRLDPFPVVGLDWATIPLELLVMICHRAPIRGRLCAISLVCKQ